jgi:CRP/FNR family transcriptional regulator, cyclic AMP receptor protein
VDILKSPISWPMSRRMLKKAERRARLEPIGSRKGAVVIVKEDVEIAKVAEPGAVFGELSVLLDQPHTAHVRALETSEFLVADATTFLAQDPIAALYVATVLARRLDGANQVFIQLKSQLEADQPRSVVAKTVEKLEGLLGVSDASLVHTDRDW